MAVIKIGIFDGEAELISFENSAGNRAELRFEPATNGFVTVNGIVSRVSDGKCILDLRLIDDGICAPVLISEDGRTALPELKKTGRELSILPPDGKYIRALSLRQRLLEKRASALEARLSELSDRIDGGGVISLTHG